MAAVDTIPRGRLSADDFETASIRSAAPSYISDAPSYTTLPPNESCPAYSPRTAPSYNSTIFHSTTTPQASQASSTTAAAAAGRLPTLPPLISSNSTGNFSRGAGLPPVPAPRQGHTSFGFGGGLANMNSEPPSLSRFRIPTWSHAGSNPTYARVAHRRAAAARTSAANSDVESALRNVLDRMNSAPPVVSESQAAGGLSPGGGASAGGSNSEFRPLEDPYLVGEEAAGRARRQRLAAQSGEDILIREDRQWDLFLAEMRDWEGRSRSWTNLRRDLDTGNRRNKLTRRVGRS